MKKTLLLFVVLFSLALGAEAQDTILMTGPKPNYLYTEWPISQGDTIGGTSRQRLCRAWQYITQDTLPIYGIAACFKISREDDLPKITEWLQIYKRHDTSMTQIGGNLEVRMTAPPTYYMQLDVYQQVSSYPVDSFMYGPVYPVYERYFREPVVVTDSFYIGVFPSDSYYYRRNDVYLQVFFMTYSEGYGFATWHPDLPTAPAEWNIGPCNPCYIPFLYAILTPPDTTVLSSDTTSLSRDTIIVRDTLVIGNDTIVTCDTILVGIGDDVLLGRLTGVIPNPAAETAQVVSSVGMGRVEVFNPAGERVYNVRIPDVSLSTTLDVSRWPAGAYILRIHTPQGIATKKLIVQK